MPTYHYRCLHCRQTQTQMQSMHEVVAPVCQACGGFTEKIIGKAPTVLKASAASTEIAEPIEPTHDCGSACVLHRQPALPKKPTD